MLSDPPGDCGQPSVRFQWDWTGAWHQECITHFHRQGVPGRGAQEDPGWLDKEGPAPPRRTSLPKPAQAEKSVSLWSIIKECVGKDLSRVCLPVFFNEPFSALQRIAEELEYSSLLDKVRLGGRCLL